MRLKSKPGRPPDFIIIGTMKSGTTALFRQLDALPQFSLPKVKEPHFFSSEERWRRGWAWYSHIFANCDAGLMTGEASVSYTSAETSLVAARRAAALLPITPLVCILRDPVARLRSHYLHEVQRGREKRLFEVALQDPKSPYVSSSLYSQCLRPWVREAGLHRLCIVRFEDTQGQSANGGWFKILQHLQVPAQPQPSVAVNATRDKANYRPLMRVAFDHGLANGRLPKALRPAARAILLERNSPKGERLRASASVAVPGDVVSRLRADADDLRRLTRDPGLCWQSLYGPGR